jgi:hypothetical protein
MPKLKQTSLPHGKPKNRTAAEAARLGISEDKLSELVKKGIIPVIKLGHSTHLFDPETTDAALLRHAAHNLLCTDGQHYPVSPEEMSRLIDREIGEVN